MIELNPKQLNQLLEARVSDVSSRKAAITREQLAQRLDLEAPLLQRSLGLWPLPPRTPLSSSVTGVLGFDGYSLEKVIFYSQPNLPVSAHLYLPDVPVPVQPVIYACASGWSKETPWVQSAGIALALRGFAALILDPPDSPERATIGTLTLAEESLGVTALGQYCWDLIRAADYLDSRKEIDSSRMGITGCDFGAYAAACAHVIERRFCGAALACCDESWETLPTVPDSLEGAAGIAAVGDWPDILALRAPTPLLLMTCDEAAPPAVRGKAAAKIRLAYKGLKADSEFVAASFVGGMDYNRRMRETMVGFFSTHLKLQPSPAYVAEARPLTDGAELPYASGTLPEDADELRCGPPPATASLRDILGTALQTPYPDPFDPRSRLIPWAKYGKLPPADANQHFTLSDDTLVPILQKVDAALCIALGIGRTEFLAQVLHLSLSGGPEGWEQTALEGHALTSMFASMKTLASGGAPAVPLKTLSAQGPVASLTASFLKLLRPEIEITATNAWSSWSELAETGEELLYQPGARYLKWPFKQL
jgi:dienelactone hydrolase